MKIPKPLEIKVPTDYAEKLGLDPTTISKINAGTRSMQPDKAALFMVLSHRDPRVRGFHIMDFFPKYEICYPHILKPRRKRD